MLQRKFLSTDGPLPAMAISSHSKASFNNRLHTFHIYSWNHESEYKRTVTRENYLPGILGEAVWDGGGVVEGMQERQNRFLKKTKWYEIDRKLKEVQSR